MRTWTRTSALDDGGPGTGKETWSCLDGDSVIAAFDVDVTVGKPLDVVGLKGSSLDDVRSFARSLAGAADMLYAAARPKRTLVACPCCDADERDAVNEMRVFGVTYRRCLSCGHCFIPVQPALEALAEHYEGSSVTYTDRSAIEIRLAQVVGPKLQWISRIFERRYGRKALSALDVGAGGGHFLEVCRRAGMRIDGYEISSMSRRFARDMFGIELKGDDFLHAARARDGHDLVTFWGLLEYTPEPKRFLETARRWFDDRDGVLVVEVPRVDSVGTAIQKGSPQWVARHMDPTSHMNVFSDASLATALLSTGFRPIAAWYFGMDAYELLTQLALRAEDEEFVRRMADVIPPLQASFDAGRRCDDIVVAAVPLERAARTW